MAIDCLYEPFKTELSSQGTVWLYSDTHFNEDEDLRTAFPNRPSAEEQVKMINSKVGKTDHLILLGDIGDIEFAKKLRGHKWLVCGNHDQGYTSYTDIFERVFSGPLMLGEKIILSHEPLDINWAFNIHGHTHTLTKTRLGHLCVCSDVLGYIPVNFNQFVKSGRLKEITPLHRITIDKATEHKAKRIKRGQRRQAVLYEDYSDINVAIL